MKTLSSDNDWTAYGRHYEQGAFWKTLLRHSGSMGRKVVEQALVLYYCLVDPSTPVWIRGVIVGALGYLIMPLDLIPDLMPVIGWLDDAGVIAAALGIVEFAVTKSHRMKGRRQADRIFGTRRFRRPGLAVSDRGESRERTSLPYGHI